MRGVFRADFRRPARRRAFFLSGTLTVKLKILAHPDASSASDVRGVVFYAPAGSDLTGAKIGEFSGKSFASALESGQAVLKVPVDEFGGSGLAPGDLPVCVWTATSDDDSPLGATVAVASVGPHDCTVIAE